MILVTLQEGQYNSLNKYIVAYSYQDKFEISEQTAQALIDARTKGLSGVQVNDQYYSTNFMWLLPVAKTIHKKLDAKQLILAGKIADWLARPIHGLEWSEQRAVDYATRLVGRVGYSEVKAIYLQHAEGSYPSVKSFLSEAKQLDDINGETDNLMLT